MTAMSKRIFCLNAAVLGLCLALGPAAPGSADDGTPTVVSAPLPTATVAPTPESEPTAVPQVERETHPVATAAASAVAEPSATPAPEVPRLRPSPTPLPTVAPLATAAVPLAPMPSASQLEENARLRWGNGIPAAVRRWAFLIVPAGRRYHLDPNLIAAVMTMESGGDPLAWNSRTDARGLMQVLHGPWDPRANVFTGARMLAGFLAQFGDLKLALAAYNAGPNAVLAYGGVPPYRETHDYVIIVSYLFDLYSHRKLTLRRRAVYKATLKDLAHFADQRSKVARLARIAHLDLPTSYLAECRHFASNCASPGRSGLTVQPDPFWPVGTDPDPLQTIELPSTGAP